MFKVTLTSARLLIAAVTLSACTPAPAPVGSPDPIEKQNRAIHDLNVDLDRALLRPVSQAYGAAVPSPVRTGVKNFASNIGLPGMILNNLMQVRLEDAVTNSFRFVLNTTFGLGGLLDIAGNDIAQQKTDFGETLYVWGVPEGTYSTLPVIGPSTSRHTVGRVVDFVINPLNSVTATPESGILTASRVGAGVGLRYEFTDLVDSVLYESADSYSQAKLLYLQNRRFALSGQSQEEDFDPYEDVYGTD